MSSILISMPMRSATGRLFMIALLSSLAGCTGSTVQHDPVQGTPPPMLLGEFEDDYGIGYSISGSEWLQKPGSRYHIVRWQTDGRYLIAQNDSGNPTDGGLWTRIDWMELTDMPPYDWAFCLSVYDAPSAVEAESTEIAHRETPRTGCNGHPFSRMQRTNR
jgi:hypothetical protein